MGTHPLLHGISKLNPAQHTLWMALSLATSGCLRPVVQEKREPSRFTQVTPIADEKKVTPPLIDLTSYTQIRTDAAASEISENCKTQMQSAQIPVAIGTENEAIQLSILESINMIRRDEKVLDLLGSPNLQRMATLHAIELAKKMENTESSTGNHRQIGETSISGCNLAMRARYAAKVPENTLVGEIRIFGAIAAESLPLFLLSDAKSRNLLTDVRANTLGVARMKTEKKWLWVLSLATAEGTESPLPPEANPSDMSPVAEPL